jgi:hypothetical protein
VPPSRQRLPPCPAMTAPYAAAAPHSFLTSICEISNLDELNFCGEHKGVFLINKTMAFSSLKSVQ